MAAKPSAWAGRLAVAARAYKARFVIDVCETMLYSRATMRFRRSTRFALTSLFFISTVVILLLVFTRKPSRRLVAPDEGVVASSPSATQTIASTSPHGTNFPPATNSTASAQLAAGMITRARNSPPHAGQISASALRQIAALGAEKRLRTPAQQKIDSQLLYADKMGRGVPIAEGVQSQRVRLDKDEQGRVVVDIRADVSDSLLQYIKSIGGSVGSSFPEYRAVRAAVPLTSIEDLAQRKDVKIIEPAVRETRSSVDSEGDYAHQADAARIAFGVDGTGVKVGVLSDSVDYLAGSQIDGLVTVVQGQGGPTARGEGTAMLEIVNDLAPGAQLYFATGKGGPAQFAANIRALRYDYGCDIIVDDELYFNESPFQDGLVGQAVNVVTASGALYFSSASNSGNKDSGTSGTWEGDFSDGGQAPDGTEAGRVHSFGSGMNYNTVWSSGSRGSQLRVDLFWTDPLEASSNDYDVYVLDAAGLNVVASSTNPQNGTQNPYEAVDTLLVGEGIVIVKFSGAGRFLHLSTGRGELDIGTPGSTRGHNCAMNAFGVAATDAMVYSYGNVFTGGSANPTENYSSDGPRRVFFQADGTPITPGNFSSSGGAVRRKPDITAADDVTTDVPGFAPFSGTSAAAPHAAGIAALLKSYNTNLVPSQIRSVLTGTALDIMAVGWDRDSGAGIVMALPALSKAPALPPGNAPATVSGKSFLAKVSGSAGNLLNTGYVLFAMAGSGNSFQRVGFGPDAGYSDNGTSTGTYRYSASAGNGSIIFSIGGYNFVGDLRFATRNSGDYDIANTPPWPWLNTQDGTFQIYFGQAPSAAAPLNVRCMVADSYDPAGVDGIFPSDTGGTFVFTTSVSGSTYTIQDDENPAADAAGPCSYSKINASSAVLQVGDPGQPMPYANSLYLNFQSAGEGDFVAQQEQGGFVEGHFTVLETVRPTLTITSPAPGQRWSNSVFTVKGAAHDNVAVASVYYQFNGGDWALATGTTNWSGSISLTPGTNQVLAYAADTSGNFSATNSRVLTYVVSDVLQLSENGLGGFTPNYSNAFLEINKSYKITAKPGNGYVFSNWTGGVFADPGTVFATTNPLSFLMQSNLSLNANFVPNPFLPRKGSYNGLFGDLSQTNRDQNSSGFFTLMLTDRGTYSASLKSGNKQWPATGSFDVGGNSTLPVKRPGTNSLTVALSLDLTSTIGLITGTASDGIWQANLFADRAEFDVRTNPATQFAHKYTLIIPGGDLDGIPVGDGYGTLTVSTSGQLIFTGNLADGTPISQVVPVSQAGYWPFYQSLYGGLGSIWEWMKFDTNIPPDDLHDSGGISWIKPAQQTARYYPSGFSGFFYADGSIYTSPLTATNPVIALSDAVVTFQDGNLSAPFTNNVLVTPSSKIVNTSSNKLTMTVVLPSGKFTGNVTPPGMNNSIPIQGAVFQNTATAYGYFLGTNASGSVELTAPPSP
jgi:hypothetical protein